MFLSFKRQIFVLYDGGLINSKIFKNGIIGFCKQTL